MLYRVKGYWLKQIKHVALRTVEAFTVEVLKPNPWYSEADTEGKVEWAVQYKKNMPKSRHE